MLKLRAASFAAAVCAAMPALAAGGPAVGPGVSRSELRNPVPGGLVGSSNGTVASGGDARFGDAVNITAFGASPTAADNSASVNAAAATGKTVMVPTGWFHLTDMVTLRPGQRMVCMGRTVSGFTVGSDFSPGSPAVIQAATAEPGSEIHDCGISFVQPPSISSRAAMLTLAQGCTATPTAGTGCKYPPAVIAPNASRLILDRVRVSAAWDGVSLPANPGGLWINDLEVGALDVGLAIDNGSDGCHIKGYHFWPFGLSSGTTLSSVYGDGNTVAAQLGRCDAMSVDDLMTYGGRVSVLADATQLDITNLRLDGDHANLEAAGGHVRVTNAYSTKSAAPLDSSILNLGAVLEIAQLTALVSNPPPIVNNAAGDTTITAGYFNQNNFAAAAATVEAGVLNLDHVHMAPAQSTTTPRTVPYVLQTGGALKVKNSRWDALAAGTLNRTAAISATVDTPGNDISGNDLGGWGFAPPAGAVLGTYGPNKTPAIPFTVTPGFQTPGDSVVTVTKQDCFYWYAADGVHGSIKLVFNTNAFSTAAGVFVIQPLPFSTAPASAPAGDGIGVQVVGFNNIQLHSGQTQMTATIAGNGSYILPAQTGPLGTQFLDTANIKPSTTGAEIDLLLFIPTN